MPLNSREDLINALERGDEDAILGTEESKWVDFKSQPYGTSLTDEVTTRQKLTDLANDVAALANQVGGLLLIGVKTEKEEGSRIDKAVEIKRIPTNLVDLQRYRTAVADQTYPPIRDLSMRWCMVVDGAGILVIEVDQARPEAYPVIVKNVEVEFSRRQLFLCVPIRRGDANDRMSIEELHSEIQMGRVLRRHGINQVMPPPPAIDLPSRTKALAFSLSAMKAERKPFFYLRAWPIEKVQLPSLYSRAEGSIWEFMEEPPRIRRDGFNWYVGGEAVSTEEGGIICSSPRISIQLGRDGLFTGVVVIDNDGLAWGRDVDSRKINPATLVEMTLLFYEHYEEILLMSNIRPERYSCQFGFSNLLGDPRPVVFYPGPLTRYNFHRIRSAPSNGVDGDVLPVMFGDPGRTAALVLAEVYKYFGFDPEGIPYATEGRIDTELIRRIGAEG